MKKALRIPLLIILLLGVGFLYLVQTPTSPISQKVLTTLGIDVGTSTPIDLTDCVSYFDGCNTCFVEDGVIGGCTLMYCETPGEPKCMAYTTDTPEVDLTDCVSYFDGCNTCMVKDGVIGGCTRMMCETQEAPRCLARVSDNDESASTGEEENIACTMEYAPVCASIAVECVTEPCPPIEETFGNACMMNANKLATFLHDGECVAK